jgi:hypothetical protein
MALRTTSGYLNEILPMLPPSFNVIRIGKITRSRLIPLTPLGLGEHPDT